MQGNNQVPKIPVVVNPDDVNDGAIKVLQVIRPHWTKNRIKYKIFSEGLTNKLYGFYLDGEPENSVVIKVYGVKTEMMIDREMEIKTMTILNKKKLGPELYGIFENGIVYEFINGQTLDTDSCKSSIIYNLVAAEMGRFHSVCLDGERAESKGSMIWEIFQRINEAAEEALTTNPTLISKFGELGVKSGWAANALAELKKIIDKENMPLTFCHNDLLLANVIYNEKISKVTYIDFEYCCRNYAPFDIANHFCEFAGADHTDFSRCPDETFKSKWISVYLQNLFEGKHSYDVKTFQRWVEICAPLSLVGWVIWGVAQANNSKIDFDYIEYVAVRIPEYEKLMKGVRMLSNKKFQ